MPYLKSFFWIHSIAHCADSLTFQFILFQIQSSQINNLKIAVCQIANTENLKYNFDTIFSFLIRAEAEKPDLIIFPECSLSGFTSKIKECSYEIIEPLINKILNWSKKTRITIILPSAFQKEGKIYKAGFWINDNGIQTFYKIGLTESEKKFFSVPNDSFNKTFTIKDFRITILICFEIEQDPYKFFSKGESDIIVWPGYWGWTKDVHWNANLKNGDENSIYKNSLEWQLPIIQTNFSFNQLENHSGEGPLGLSHVIDKDSKLVYSGKHKENQIFYINLEKNHENTIITSVID